MATHRNVTITYDNLPSTGQLTYDSFYALSHSTMTKIYDHVTNQKLLSDVELHDTFDLLSELEFYMPSSKTCFPTTQILNEWTIPAKNDYLPRLLTHSRNKLLTLCKYPETLTLLHAIYNHITVCRTYDLKHASHSPCFSIMLSYLPLITDPIPTGLGELQLPFLKNRLSNHFSDLSRRFHPLPMHSYLDSPVFNIPRPLVMYIQQEIHATMYETNQPVPCVLRSPCFFQPNVITNENTQITMIQPQFHVQHDLSFPSKDEIEHRLSHLSTVTPDISSENFTSHICIKTPITDNPRNALQLQLTQDCRAILINMISPATIYDILSIPDDLRFHDAPEYLLLNILNDFKLFTTYVFNDDTEIYPSLQHTITLTAKAYGQTLNVNRPNGIQLTDDAFQSMFVLPKLLRLGVKGTNSQYPNVLRNAFGPILPRYASTYDTFIFLNLVCYLIEYLYEDSNCYPLIPKPEQDSHARFLMCYPLINPHSLRLYDYFNHLEFPSHIQVPNATRFLTTCATTGRYSTWTKFKYSPIDIKINDRQFRNYSISTKSYFNKVVVFPSQCSQQESIVLHRLGRHAPGYDQYNPFLQPETSVDEVPDDYDDLYYEQYST